MGSAKFFSVMLLAMVKTLVSPPLGFATNMSFGMTFLAVATGGLLGFFLFFSLFDLLIKSNEDVSQKKRIRRIGQARKLIKMKRKYPLWLFLFILPLFSIPVMAFIIRKFYCRDRKIIILCTGIIIIWSLGSCVVYSPIILL